MRFFILLSFACNSDFDVKHINPPASGQDTADKPQAEVAEEVPQILETCPDRIWAAGEVAIDESCAIEPPTGSFNPIIEWQFSEFTEYPNAVNAWVSPLIGQLTDDNNDGVVDVQDVPDILSMHVDDPTESWCASGTESGVLSLSSGDGSQVH